MSTEQLVPGADVIEITIGTDDVDLVATYGSKATEIHVVENSGSLVVETQVSKASAAYRTLTVYPDWRKICYVNVIRGSDNGSTSGLKVQLTFN